MSERERRTDTKSDDLEIDLLQLAQALWKRAWLIILVGILGGAITFGGTKLLITPTYQSSFTAYVNNRSSQEVSYGLSSSDISAAQSLVYTYSEIITSRTILESAAQAAGLVNSYDELKEMVSAEALNNTEIIEVSVYLDDPQLAAKFANAICDIAPEYVSQVVEGSSMQVLDKAVEPTEIYKPNYLKTTILGAVLLMAFTCALIVLRELLDDRIKDEAQLEEQFGVPVIGTIPNLESAKKVSSSYGYGYSNSGKGRTA